MSTVKRGRPKGSKTLKIKPGVVLGRPRKKIDEPFKVKRKVGRPKGQVNKPGSKVGRPKGQTNKPNSKAGRPKGQINKPNSKAGRPKGTYRVIQIIRKPRKRGRKKYIMPDEEKMIIMRQRGKGLTIKSIAARMGIPASTLAVRLRNTDFSNL
jgi:hypothetical protein